MIQNGESGQTIPPPSQTQQSGEGEGHARVGPPPATADWEGSLSLYRYGFISYLSKLNELFSSGALQVPNFGANVPSLGSFGIKSESIPVSYTASPMLKDLESRGILNEGALSNLGSTTLLRKLKKACEEVSMAGEGAPRLAGRMGDNIEVVTLDSEDEGEVGVDEDGPLSTEVRPKTESKSPIKVETEEGNLTGEVLEKERVQENQLVDLRKQISQGLKRWSPDLVSPAQLFLESPKSGGAKKRRRMLLGSRPAMLQDSLETVAAPSFNDTLPTFEDAHHPSRLQKSLREAPKTDNTTKRVSISDPEEESGEGAKDLVPGDMENVSLATVSNRSKSASIRYVCKHCGTGSTSKNGLIRHLKNCPAREGVFDGVSAGSLEDHLAAPQGPLPVQHSRLWTLHGLRWIRSPAIWMDQGGKPIVFNWKTSDYLPAGWMFRCDPHHLSLISRFC